MLALHLVEDRRGDLVLAAIQPFTRGIVERVYVASEIFGVRLGFRGGAS